MATSTPSTAAIIAKATELLSGVLADEQIKEFVKANKIRTFGKLAVLAEEAIIANSKPKSKRAARRTEADAAPNTRWARAAATRIEVLVSANPKRGAAAARFALYMAKGGTTVGAFLAAGGRAKDLNWDLRHGFIAVAE